MKRSLRSRRTAQRIEKTSYALIKTVSVACLVLIDAYNNILVTQRPLHKALGGLWEFPGGKIEANESPEAALRREIYEELKLGLSDLAPLASVHYTYDFAVITLVPFLSRCADRPSIQLVEHIAFRWIHLKESEALDWAPADIPILNQLMDIIYPPKP